jgi:adenosylcobinamide-GDP ribazoletransferase
MSEPENTPDSPREPPRPRDPVVTIKPPSAESMWAEMVIAFNYLTRFNFKAPDSPPPRLVRRSMTWFPLIGALIGIFGASIDWILTEIGLPSLITATFAVVGMLWLTRALHEEEVASLVNQYSQPVDKEKKWLMEERSIRYGTLGVILIIVLKIGAIASLSSSDLVFQVLIGASCWSRALMVLAAAWLRPLPGDPVSDYFQQPPALRVVFALLIGAALNLAVFGGYADRTLGAGLVAGLLVALVAGQHIRGYNGQLMGTLLEAVELTMMGVVLALQ